MIVQNNNSLLFLLVDETPPEVRCPDNIRYTIDINTDGRTVDFKDATAKDNSRRVILVNQSHQSGQFFPTGQSIVTYTFQDPSGNIASCSFSVTVIEGRKIK